MKFKKVVITSLLSGVMMTSMPIYAANTDTKDVANDFWAKKQISWTYDKNYLSGYPDGTFKPQENMTNAEFISLVIRILSNDTKLDVNKANEKMWYSKFLNKAEELGIISSAANIDPNAKITRDEAFRLLAFAYSVKGNIATLDEFTDKDLVKNKEAVAGLLEKKVVTGYPDKTLRPNNLITRAEVSNLVYIGEEVARLSKIDINKPVEKTKTTEEKPKTNTSRYSIPVKEAEKASGSSRDYFNNYFWHTSEEKNDEKPSKDKPSKDDNKPEDNSSKDNTKPENKPGTKPGTEPETPGTEPETPGKDTENPEIPGTPGTEPGTPGTEPETPGNEPETPGEDPSNPDTNPNTPPEDDHNDPETTERYYKILRKLVEDKDNMINSDLYKNSSNTKRYNYNVAIDLGARVKDWDHIIKIKNAINDIKRAIKDFSVPSQGEYTFDKATGKIIQYKQPYIDRGENLVIPDTIEDVPVKEIDASAFKNCGFGSIKMPNTITKIGAGAFSESKATSVQLSANLESIGGSAFSACDLTSISFPNTLKEIGRGAFYGNKLSSISIPDSVTTMGDAAFRDNELTSVKLSKNLTRLSEDCFFSNKLTSIEIPGSVKTIGANCFLYNKELESVTFESGLERIERQAFRYLKVKSVELPDTVEYVGEHAFANNRISNLKLSKNITELGTGAFRDNLISHVDIPNSLRKLPIDCFRENVLKTVIIPGSLDEVGPFAFAYNELTDVTFPERNIYIQVYAFIGNKLTSVKFYSTTDPDLQKGSFDDGVIIWMKDHNKR